MYPVVTIDEKSREVLLDFGNMDKNFRGAIRRGQIANGSSLKKHLRAGIKNPPKSGIKHRSLPNISSRAGEYPATQSGKLMNSVEYRTSGLNMKIGYIKKYGKFLELGTKNMDARPGLITTIRNNLFRLKYNFMRELNRGLGRK